VRFTHCPSRAVGFGLKFRGADGKPVQLREHARPDLVVRPGNRSCGIRSTSAVTALTRYLAHFIDDMGVKYVAMNGCLIKVFTAMLVLSFAVADSSSQSATSAHAQESVVLIRLFQPIYPPLARQTRITGDVELILEVKTDGSLESASVLSGHPLLKQAALDSAQRSQFECRDCTERVRSFHMFYSFQLGPTRYCAEASETSKDDEKKEPYPRVIQSQNHVTVIDQPVGTCDPVFTVTRTKVRSAKCLYLWRCGFAR
jgi:TonB family protein